MTLDITIEDYQIIRKGLLELKAKDVLFILSKLDTQVIKQSKQEAEKCQKDSQTVQ